MNTLCYTLCVCKERYVSKPRQQILYFLYLLESFLFTAAYPVLKKQVNIFRNINSILLMPQLYINNYTFLQTWIILHHSDVYHKKYWHRVSLTRRSSSLWLPTQTGWWLCYRRSTVNTCTVITASFAWVNFYFRGQNSVRIYVRLERRNNIKKEKNL
jgi:hypothetical protein